MCVLMPKNQGINRLDYEGSGIHLRSTHSVVACTYYLVTRFLSSVSERHDQQVRVCTYTHVNKLATRY